MLSDKRYCVTIFSTLALIAFVFVMRFLPDLFAWQASDLCGDDCDVRSWLEATSGWAGFVAAGIAVILTGRQIRQQQKQTDFMLGDAPPTMDVTPYLDDPTEMVVRIVNWNRRSIFIKSIDVNVGNAIGIMELKLDDKEVDLGKVRWPFPLRGWEDRNNSGPHALQMKISAAEGDKIVSDWPKHAEVIVGTQMLDTKHRVQSLRPLCTRSITPPPPASSAHAGRQLDLLEPRDVIFLGRDLMLRPRPLAVSAVILSQALALAMRRSSQAIISDGATLMRPPK